MVFLYGLQLVLVLLLARRSLVKTFHYLVIMKHHFISAIA